MVIKHLAFKALLFAALSPTLCIHTASWKVFVLIEASDGLTDMAIKNISDMMRVSPRDEVEFLVQLHAYDNIALRYRVQHSSLTFIEQAALSGNSKQDCINALTWAFADTSADHTMLIFSNHGWGILDPLWNDKTQEWHVDNDGLSNTCIIKRSPPNACTQHRHMQHKAFLFTVQPRTYLSNQDLIESMHALHNKRAHKKLDIVAFDTCMGNMIEIAYELAPYTNILVGSQTCSLRDGFDYQSIIATLNQLPSAHSLAQSMVRNFNAYYATHDALGIYTHAALDLAHVNAVRESLDTAIDTLLELPRAQYIANQARATSPRFCLWPMYTDLVAFWKGVSNQLKKFDQSEQIDTCKKAINSLCSALNQCIISRCAGHAVYDATHGTAIYLPERHAYESYRATPFARDSRWINLLDLMNRAKDAHEDQEAY